jgi:hypothetical protein
MEMDQSPIHICFIMEVMVEVWRVKLSKEKGYNG